jgi:hypothetical protein
VGGDVMDSYTKIATVDGYTQLKVIAHYTGDTLAFLDIRGPSRDKGRVCINEANIPDFLKAIGEVLTNGNT